MLLEDLSLDGKPQGQCFAEECKDCNFYRLNKTTTLLTKEEKIKRICQWQLFFNTVPDIVGSIDGVQAAANEARNRSVESKEAIVNLGQATLKSFEMIDKRIKHQDSILIED